MNRSSFHNGLRHGANALTFALAVVTLAATSHGLVARNDDVNKAGKAAEAVGVKLVLNDVAVLAPSWVLGSASIALILNTIVLFALTFRAPGVAKHRFTGFLGLVLAGELVYTLIALGSLLAITIDTATKSIQARATLGAITLPPAVIAAQAASLGLTLVYWDKSYVRFIVIAGWILVVSAIATLVLGFMYLRDSKRVRAHASSSPGSYTHPLAQSVSTEKATSTHV